MPVFLENIEFIDEWGNSTPFYRSNAGDRTTMRLGFRSVIYMSSAGNPFILEPQQYLVTCGSSWEAEGFRVGDTVEARITNSAGTPISGGSFTTTVDYLSGNVIGFTSIPTWYDTSQQQIMFFVVVGRNRQGIECRLNHVQNDVPGNDFSLIDGEATRFTFNNVDSITVGSFQNAVIVGNQSGQYLLSAKITRLPDPAVSDTAYTIEVVFCNSGIYDETQFDSSDCLKVILKTLWSSIQNEPYGQTAVIYNSSANTGWFDEAHNSSEINATMVQGITELDYVNPTSFTVIVDEQITELGIGASYIPADDSYFKNKALNQGRYAMLLPTSELTVTTYTSFSNPDFFGSGYEIEVTNINTVGATSTIDLIFTPNPDFATLMESREEGDRLFYLWIKCGNLNLRAFNGQLTTVPAVGGELIMEESKAFYDHAENTNDGSGTYTDSRFDTEDDIAYFGTFLMDKDLTNIYSSFSVKIEAFNTVTEEDFTLKQTVFSFASTQVDSNGVYLIDQTTTVNANLPLTSLKRDALLKRDASIDTLTQFGVSIYYPVVLDWRYWMAQLNASTDFYPNQNRNWQQYSGSGNWIVRMELELIKSGLSFTHSDEITILNYDAKSQIVSTMQYSIFPSGTITTGLISGEIMKLRAQHVNLFGSWTPQTWGNIRIEKKESSPDWLSSTVLDYDNVASNPLFPLPGETKAKLTLIADTAHIECLCDTNKLPSTGTYSVSYKIKDPDEPLPPLYKTMAPDDMIKTMAPDDTFKTLA